MFPLTDLKRALPGGEVPSLADLTPPSSRLSLPPAPVTGSCGPPGPRPSYTDSQGHSPRRAVPSVPTPHTPAQGGGFPAVPPAPGTSWSDIHTPGARGLSLR